MREITSHVGEGLPNSVRVFATDDPHKGGANHTYELSVKGPEDSETKSKQIIRFQKGPIKEDGANGVTNESLLAIVIDRLKGFQAGPLQCLENELALANIGFALDMLHKRTKTRVNRKVEGTSKP